MKNLIIILFTILSSLAMGQTISNAKTVEVAISGNCGMCKSTIEKAANVDGVAHLEWNKSTKMATLTYDAKETSPKDVLKRVADAGYDNELFTADAKSYESLAPCCHYDRQESTKKEKAACCSTEGKKSCSTEGKAKPTKSVKKKLSIQ